MKTLSKTLLITFLTLLLVCSSSAPTYGQGGDDPVIPPDVPAGNIRFEHLTTEDGLSEGRVWGITQDRRGFMWFATWDGLNRYDGYEFKVYKQEPDNPSSPGGNSFWVITEDRAGMIWAGSPTGGGLSRFDPTTERWRRYQHDPDDPYSLSSNNVYAILEDSAGVLWIGTEGGGLNQFDGETEDGQARFTRFGYDPNAHHSLGSAFVSSIYEDRSGVLWIGTYGGGLHRFDRETDTFTRYQHNPDDPGSLSYDVVYPIYEDRFGVLWVGTYGGGLNRFDREAGTFRRYQHDPQDPNSLGGNTVTGIGEDQSGTLWVATFDGGLCRYHRETDTFTTYKHDDLDPRSLVSSTTTALFVDRSGILWIGTAGSGISKLDPSAQAFVLYRHNPTDSNSLSNNDIRAVYEDRFGDLWIGTWGGLNRLDPETGRFTHYRHDPADPDSLSDNHVFAIEEDSAGVLWVGVDTHGLNRLDRDTETFSHYRHDPTDPDSLSDDTVISLYADRMGILWVGTFAGGLDAFDPQSQHGQARFTHHRHDPEDPRSLGEGIVYSILEDQAGVLWVGTGGGGLCRYDRDTETFDCYKHDPQDADSLGDDAVWALYEDREGALWIGTSGGLNRLDSRTGKLLRYTTADGLPHNTVHGILEDNASSPDAHGYLWLSTARGLSRFDPQAGTFQNYGANDGLPGGGFNWGAHLKASTGELLFGSPNGLTRFYPDHVQDNPHIPPVHITGIQVADIPVTVSDHSPLQEPVLAAEELVLARDDRIVSFEFAALSYNAPQENRYRYKLEGFEEEWHEVGSDRRSATYTNLDPGEYTFRVLGSNNHGVWNEEGDSLKVTVTPPWWGTGWFRGLAVLVVVGLVFGAYRWRVRSIERRSRELKREIEIATWELAERVKELNCLYGISRLAGQQEVSLEEILQGTVQLIPPALQYPQIACARVTLDGREFKTANFEESPWQQKADIVVRARRAGSVEVGYLEQRPEQDEGPFLTEEIDLLKAIAERLGRIAERKQAEEQVRFQAHLLATIEQAVMVTDISGHVVYWNPFAERLFGWSAEEVVGRKTIEFFLIADEQARQQDAEIMASMRTSGNWSGEYVARRRDGTHLPLQSTITAITNAGGELTHIVGVMADITERKQTEEALRKSEEKHRDLVEKISDVIYSVDSGGVITYLNPAIEALIGLPPEQVVGQLFAQFIHPEDLGRLQDNLQSLLSGAAPGSAEYRVLSTAGEVRWIRVTSQPMVEEGQVIGVQGVLSDVTERKRLEEKLQEAAKTSERQRLARDLHDSVTQTLYSTNLFADATHLALATGRTDAAREHLDAVRDLVWQTTLEMRMLLFELRPPLLEETGLAGALQTRLESVEARVGLPIEFIVEGERRLPPSVEAELYHVALEALNNIAKHAQATQATVRLTLEEERCWLVIHDDGVGFDPEAASLGGGHGLRTMQERIAQIGGRLDLETTLGQGTTVTIEVKA